METAYKVYRTCILYPTLFFSCVLSTTQGYSPHTPKCRFSPSYSVQDVLANSEEFVWDLLYWEGNFHQNNVGYNSANGMTYDGTLLDPTSGIANLAGLHQFSAASKESIHIMILAHAVAGDPLAARFLSPHVPHDAPRIAVEILETKLQTYLKFNETFPGFGGFLPWFANSGTAIQPTWDWVNRVPALDNGYVPLIENRININ